MTVRRINYEPSLPSGTGDTNRGPSRVIWDRLNIGDYLEDPYTGMYFFDDFEVAPSLTATSGGAVVGSFGRWALYAGKTAAVTDAGIVGGGLTLTPGTSASNEGFTLSSLDGCFQFTSGSSSGIQAPMAFEARVMLQSVTASMRDAFVGLCDTGVPAATTPLTAGTSSNNLTSTINLIGFMNAYSGGGQDWAFVYQLANTAIVFASNLNSLVSRVTGSAIAANTWYKLGFLFNPLVAQPTKIGTISTGQTAGNVARAMLQVFVNGIPAAAFLTQAQNIYSASFPTGIMGPVVSIMNDVSSVGASTNAGALSIDWLRVAQNASV